MSTQNQPRFDTLECVSCQSDTLHYAIVDRENMELVGGLCMDCAPEDRWSEVDETCVFCKKPYSYSLEAINLHPDYEDKSTYKVSQSGPLLCEEHFNELS